MTHTQIDVNGPKAHELFSFLKNEVKDPTLPYDIRWNFGKQANHHKTIVIEFGWMPGPLSPFPLSLNKTGKFLVVNGRPVKRYAHDVAPADMEKDIVTFLRKAHTGEL